MGCVHPNFKNPEKNKRTVGTQHRIAPILSELDEIGRMTRRLVQRLEERAATSR